MPDRKSKHAKQVKGPVVKTAHLRRLSKDHLNRDFIGLQERLGRRPKLFEYKQQCHTLKVLDRTFGKPGWKRLVENVGDKVLPKDLLTADHLIQDYLETCMVLSAREVSYTKFHLRHRHSPKTLERVFGRPGYNNLKKAAAQATYAPVEKAPPRQEYKIMRDIRATYRALLPGRIIDGRPTRAKTRISAWKLRNRLHDLFHELGRVVGIEEAFQKRKSAAGSVKHEVVD